ncbi:hypothetical protein BJ741DRAFT_631563 [Chytriomyces cf. hyalinus JEL632]|nr:hypothetical protein BJ741DRAFT_631563 [Chytriomyces cf. hyalinus JEL632]
MSKQDALAQARLAHTAQLILQQIQDHPFLKEPPSTLNALGASELRSFRHTPFMCVEKASAFIERQAEMETHQAYISQFGFPKKEKYWGILSHKSRERIKDLAASEWACLRADDLFVTEGEAMLDSLKKADIGSVKYRVRKSELHSSKRVERRSEMKKALAFMACK